MRAQGSTGVEALDLEVGRLTRRARLNLILSRLTWGAFIGGAAGILYALVSDFIPIPFHPLAFAGLAAAAGALAGAALGALFPQDPVPLLIRADKALANHELSSTAYELATRGKKSIFSDAIIEDAVLSLSRADPARILVRPRSKLLPVLPIVLAAALMLSIFPMNLRELFMAKPRVEPALRSLGEELEGFGRKLEKKAAEENLQRSLQLSQELQRLGKDFQNESIDQGEAAQRLQELESRLADEYAMRIEEMLTQSKKGGGDGKGTSGQNQGQGDNNSPQQGQGGEEGSNSRDPNADAESQDLSDVLNMLSQRRQSLGSQPPGAGSNAPRPGPMGKGEGEGQQEGEGEAQMAQGGDANSSQSESTGNESKAGNTPVQDSQGPASNITRSTTGDQLQAEVPVTEGDTMQMLMRALPSAGSSTVPDREQLQSYQRTAENALAQEEVPVELREYVREYFISIGMMGKDSQGR